MKKLKIIISGAIISLMILLIISFTGCKKEPDPIKFPKGTFPDSVYNITGLNSQYDDYNSNVYSIGSRMPIIFSSNRGSSGGQYDLVQGALWYSFDQTTGKFDVGGEIESDLFYGSLITAANTAGNDFGPYSIFSSTDGFEYLLVASQGTGGQLDLQYFKHLPRYSNIAADIKAQGPVTLLNSSVDDAYISFDTNEDTAYFCSNRGGNFDIYLQKRPAGMTLENWLKMSFASSTTVDSINSAFDEKCPFFYKDIMVFASNRPGGMGGYDLYYTVFKNGNWSFPINMGPDINTASDEFRPLLGYHQDFTNLGLLFSSDRPGGKGGFDLYFTGFTYTK
jgi:hypothetical protein